MLKISIYGKVLSLPLGEVQLKDCQIFAEEGRTVFEVTVKKRRKTGNCPRCGKRTKKLHEQKIYEKKGVKHLFTSDGKEIRLKLLKRQYRCCGDTFFERFSFEAGGWYTKTFEQYILQEWKHLSVLELSRRTGVSDHALWRMINGIDVHQMAQEGMQYLDTLEEIHLGLDGHSFRGHDMVMMVTEVKTRKVVAILEAETNACVRLWLNQLPPRVLMKIRSFVIDMKAGVKYTIKKTIGGNVIEVVDHYHVVQEANKMVDEVRRLGNWLRREVKRELMMIVKKSKGKEKNVLKKILHEGEISSYVEIKRRRIFLKAEERLSPHEQELLNMLLRRCRYLREAWLEKELLRESLQKKDPELLRKVLEDCLKSTQYRIRQFGRTIRRWYQAICNFFTLNITNAFTEGINNKAKVFKRIAFGYRNKQSYIRKLYCSL